MYIYIIYVYPSLCVYIHIYIYIYMCVCVYIYICRYEDGPKRVKVISVSFLIIFGRFLGNESHCGMISNFFNGPGRS